MKLFRTWKPQCAACGAVCYVGEVVLRDADGELRACGQECRGVIETYLAGSAGR